MHNFFHLFSFSFAQSSIRKKELFIDNSAFSIPNFLLFFHPYFLSYNVSQCFLIICITVTALVIIPNKARKKTASQTLPPDLTIVPISAAYLLVVSNLFYQNWATQMQQIFLLCCCYWHSLGNLSSHQHHWW
mmetsp:Transcript_4135/g.5310  ORF Transcript_4135/g.5310 Transcript_4135/m.5310 type:complete len:132 (+) Transcript_4135:146-541(+)